MTSKRQSIFRRAGACLLACAPCLPFGAGCDVRRYPKIKEGEKTTAAYTETPEAFANPMKGFRPTRYLQDAAFPSGEYASVCKQYVKYTDLEESADDTAQKIIEWSNRAWKGIESKNLKVIPRVVIVYPNGPDGGDSGYWPEGIRHDDPVYCWLTDPFKRRLRDFIAKLGQAWDNDPRVAAVEAGLWGKWGEHHISPLNLPNGGGNRIPADFQVAIGDAFAKAFPNKKVMVRYPETFTDYDFGFYWDSFALPDDKDCGKQIIQRKEWKTQMISGEVAYDWGDQSLLGGKPDATLSSEKGTASVIDWIGKTHASSLGWISDYTQTDKNVAENAALMQKKLGYRYVIQSAGFTKAVRQGDELSLTFNVSNVGSAPFYYPWPVEVSLLDQDRAPVWKDTVPVDIRNWRPGNTYTVTGRFTVPKDLRSGTYTLALAVLDPSGNLPSLRFANTNYYKGGRTPLGIVGVGHGPEETVKLEPFDSLYSDRTLHYTLEGGPGGTVQDTQSYPPEPEEVIDTTPELHSVKIPGNLAYQKPVTVSSTETQYQNYAPGAVDGDPETRWSSEWGKDPSWIAVDLQEPAEIGGVTLKWEWSYAKSYEIQVSDDGNKWKSVYHTDEGRGKTEKIQFKPVKARYVRVYCIQRALQWGYSLYEIEVYAPEK